jgi:two-component system sensor histidine kinase DesK
MKENFTGSRWFAAVWLIYVPFVFVEPYQSRAPLQEWAISALTIAIFLPLYFGAFQNASRHAGRARAMTVAMAVLGLALVPFNIGGSTYAIFSAAVAGFVFPGWRHSLGYVAGISLALAAVILATRRPAEFWMFVQPGIVLVVGLGNVIAAEERRRNAFVRRAQEEVEEMAKLAERERIARDLHDVLGHTLSVIALKSELASKLATIDPQHAAEEIRDVERVSRTALSEVRHAVEATAAMVCAAKSRAPARPWAPPASVWTPTSRRCSCRRSRRPCWPWPSAKASPTWPDTPAPRCAAFPCGSWAIASCCESRTMASAARRGRATA